MACATVVGATDVEAQKGEAFVVINDRDCRNGLAHDLLEKETLRVGGAPEGRDAQLLAELARRADGPVLHVARDDARLAALAEALAFFAPDLPVLRFPAWDCLPYDRISPNAEISAARMAALAALADWADKGAAPCALILTTLNAATQRVPARAHVSAAAFAAPPEIGASSQSSPAAAALAASVLATSGAMVAQLITTAPGLRCTAIPPSPNTAPSVCAAFTTTTATLSNVGPTSAAVPVSPPSPTNAAARSASTSSPSTSSPPASAARAMPPPIAPSPITAVRCLFMGAIRLSL